MVPLRRASVLLLRCLVVAALALGAVRTTLFTVYRVAGTSMLDALLDGDRILVCDVPWLLGEVSPGDTVVLTVDGEVLVKRVLAGPGDHIALLDGHVIRNGRLVPESIPPERVRPDELPELAMGPDEYFVLGDNRRVSVDSRDFGPVHGAQLLGRVVLRMGVGGVSPVAALERH